MDHGGGSGAGATRPEARQIYEDHFSRVYAFALRIVGDEEEARDIAQETFVAVVDGIGAFRGESAVCTWVLSIAKNLCYKRLKDRREKKFSDIEAIIDEYSEEPSAEQSILERRFYIEEVRNGCLLGLLQCLNFAQRCVFVLHLLNDVPIAEIAVIMGKSPNSIRIILSRARAGMRDFLCANCSMVRKGARCSCANMIAFSLKRNLIEKYHPRTDIPEIQEELRRFADEVELYRALPAPEIAIARLLESGRYKIFPNS
jgi:RNA polymerase sigma factor (sigma-70 family)